MLKISDPQLFNLINEEIQRQKNTYSLIASENICSVEVLEALGSPLTNKYSEGYPLKRYYNGNKFIDEIELLAIERAKKIFGCEFANVQAYSGSPANHAVYLGLLEPGDTVLGFDLASGGHLTHGAKVNFSGKYYNSQNYFVDSQTNLLNYDEISDIAHKLKPKLIVAGLTAYPREIDFKKFSEIAKSVGAYLLADISHISGMVAVGLHNSPIGFADVVMTTTHKQLRGPRGALILSNNEELMTKINKAVFPGLQGGPHNNQTAAIAVALNEALDSNYKVYIEKVIQNIY
jgi:glycine hydroxymethyltransferase